ncbi:hypothetical protein B0F87_102200 [Methylobacter tundripaludum]|uniref:Uncharacterized protein n=1 Tax=Methylobacter tundripaludum TaxID=173365 RepID=A0A2S6HHZ3_9GAMM|nr:hypothetical protein B0F87_102200 [Methylobacter tundripaludum]
MIFFDRFFAEYNKKGDRGHPFYRLGITAMQISHGVKKSVHAVVKRVFLFHKAGFFRRLFSFFKPFSQIFRLSRIAHGRRGIAGLTFG